MPLSDSEKKRCVDMFKQVDTSGDGTLSVLELVKAVRAMGWDQEKFPNNDICHWFLDMDTDGDHKVELNEFVAAFEKRPRAEVDEANLRRSLREVDEENTGTVMAEKVKVALAICNIDLKGETDSILKKADKAGDGKINVEEFIGLVNFSTMLPKESVP